MLLLHKDRGASGRQSELVDELGARVGSMNDILRFR